MWLDKLRELFKKGIHAEAKAPEEKLPDERGLDEEMVSGSVDLEPKENDGLAKIFEETGKKELDDSESGKKDAEQTDQETKQE